MSNLKMTSTDLTTTKDWNNSPETTSQAYQKLCCLFLNWNDAPEDKITKLSDLQKVLHDQYGAFITSITVDHTDLEDSDRAFYYAIENFIKENDSRSNLLMIVYSGCSYVHEGQLFLEPHLHTEPNVEMDGRRSFLATVSTVLLVFDTTCLRENHYQQWWKRVSRKESDAEIWNPVLNLLVVNGSETVLLIEALRSMALSRVHGFSSSELSAEILRKSEGFSTQTLVYNGEGTPSDLSKEVILLPLKWPKLKLYEHTVLRDPHGQYLKDCNPTEIQKEGACEVIKLRIGADIQDFSSGIGLGSSCIVAIKRFTLKGRRRFDLRGEFLRERENLAKVSAWRHDHLLGMFASFETTGARFDTLNIVLPFAGGGNLYHFLRLERETRWEQHGYPIATPGLVGCLADWRYAVYREAIGLVNALASLHSDENPKYMIHCDIKPANVLIQKGTFKLADFGLSRFKDSEETSKTTWYLGTVMYSPPEKDGVMGRGRDVWALGCVLLEIAFMIRYAFQSDLVISQMDVTNMIDDFKIRREISSQMAGREKTAIYYKTMICVEENIRGFLSMRGGLRRMITVDGLIPVINKMLKVDPIQRIKAAEALKILEGHYRSLQEKPGLQRDIEWRDNPGGPLEWSPEDHKRLLEESAGWIAGTEMHEATASPFVGPHQRPPMLQGMGASFGATAATSATPQLHDMRLQDRKRSSSAEENSRNKRPWHGAHY